MRTGIYPGSFDPLTNGHLDLINRSVLLCDKLLIAVANNSAKKPLFSVDERIEIINNCCEKFKGNIEAVSFDGLLAQYCKTKKISFIIRGLRNVSDFEYEQTLSAANRTLAPEVETIFLMAKPEFAFVSSNLVREIALHNGDLSSFMPQFAAEKTKQKISQK